MTPPRRPRVLVLSRNYPNEALPTLGIWVQRLARAAARVGEIRVVAPVPYVPPGIGWWPRFARFRGTSRTRSEFGFTVHHPRVPVGPGYRLHPFDAAMSWPFVRRAVTRLHAEEPFDLIHAHFVYPDGVVAARLGRYLGIPVVTTEHAVWIPWLRDWPSVQRQVGRALPHLARVTTVSRAVADTVQAAFPGFDRVAVVPNVLDDETFRLPEPGGKRDPDQILFVGVVRRVKGLDVLVRALPRLLQDRPNLRLVVVGEPHYGAYRRDELEVRTLIAQLDLGSRVDFRGQCSPTKVAEVMGASAVLVVPSRRESFSSVTVEALACGTPVVATRCGGPQEILEPGLGLLVPPEDPEALAHAIADVLTRRSSFTPEQLRSGVVSRFGWARSAERLGSLYQDVLRSDRGGLLRGR